MSQKTCSSSHARYLRPTAAGQRRVGGLGQRIRAMDGTVSELLHLAPFVGLEATPALDRAIREYMRLHQCNAAAFIKQVLEPTVACALEFDSLFGADEPARATARREASPLALARRVNTPSAVSLNQREAQLSRRQLYCVVSNAFFCAFAHRPQKYDDALPTIDYGEIHTAADGDNDVEVVKLMLLFDYFRKAGATKRSTAIHKFVEIFRPRILLTHPCFSAKRFRRVMQPPVVHALRESIDDQKGMLRLDFANRWIGGGALSDGCVQEEITFAQCPELNALRWLHGPLEPNESIVVRGYSQYARIQAGTYGYGIKYGGPLPHAKRLGGALLAVDAVDYRYEEPSAQYSAAAIDRELLKLVSGLALDAVRDVPQMAGGNWGCGVFGGDVELKFLLQWLACHLCEKELHYFPFDKPMFAVYASVTRQLCRTGLTGETLLKFMQQLDAAGDRGEAGGSVLSDLLIFASGPTADTSTEGTPTEA